MVCSHIRQETFAVAKETKLTIRELLRLLKFEINLTQAQTSRLLKVVNRILSKKK